MEVTQYHIDSKSEPGTFRIVSAMEDGTWECDCPFVPRKNGGPNQRCRHILEAQAGVVAGQLESPAAPLDPEWGALTTPGALPARRDPVAPLPHGQMHDDRALSAEESARAWPVYTPADPKASFWAALRAPFDAKYVSKLPKPFKRDSEKGDCPECGKYHGLPAVHLDYVGHAEVTSRLLEVDPLWNWEPMAFDDDGLPRFGLEDGWPVGLWIRLTIGGVTRLGFGSVDKGAHDAEKQLIGDAIRNAAMRFGVAIDLWSKADRNDPRDDEPRQGRGPAREAMRNSTPQSRQAYGAPSWWQDFLAKRTDLGLAGQHVGIAIGSPCTPENVEAWVKQDPEAPIEDRLNKLLSAAADAKASQR